MSGEKNRIQDAAIEREESGLSDTEIQRLDPSRRAFVWRTSEDRQEIVFYLLERGFKKHVIAQMVIPPVHRNTVARDLAAIRERQRSKAIELDEWSAIGESLAFFRSIEQKCIRDYHDQDASSGLRAAHIKNAIMARDRSLALMMDTGIIQRAPTKVNGSLTYDGKEVDYDRMSDEELAEREVELLEALKGTTPLVAKHDEPADDEGAGDDDE